MSYRDQPSTWSKPAVSKKTDLYFYKTKDLWENLLRLDRMRSIDFIEAELKKFGARRSFKIKFFFCLRIDCERQNSET